MKDNFLLNSAEGAQGIINYFPPMKINLEWEKSHDKHAIEKFLHIGRLEVPNISSYCILPLPQ
jgi:hypothetical protein